MFETPRLLLRQWKESDFEAFADMNADPEVMRFYDRVLSKQESFEVALRLQRTIAANGHGLWVVELKENATFLGFVGVSDQDFGFSASPIKEIGWRLKRSAWGYGYATEAAREVFDDAKKRFDEIYSVTAKINLKSRAVMERIGLQYRPELDFEHPRVAKLELKEHVVYKNYAN